jgi:glycosyltransferase involved in cell wall biosynthesis
MPQISVIMSVYNGEKFVSTAIESILDQSFKDFEFIIVDDGSTDSTPEVLSKYAQKDSRIRFIKNDMNIGLTKSLNKAIDSALGDFIARQDADDISLSNRLERQLSVACQTGADIIGCQAYVSNNNVFKILPRSELLEKLSLSTLKFGNPFIHGTLFFKASVLKYYKYDEEFRYAQDYDLMIRLMKAKKSLFMISEALYVSKISDESATKSKRDEQLACAHRICKNHFGTAFFHIDEKNPIRHKLSVFLRKLLS